MSSCDDNYYKSLLAAFQINDLQQLLTTFGRNKNGRKQQLIDRVIDLIIKRPPGLNRQLFLAKISEIHQSIQNRNNVPNNRIMMGTMLNQRQIMPLSVQTQSQRMIPPQYSQQPSQHIPRPRLPYVVPQTQRGMYGGNINGKNNFQYSYQVGASHNLLSQVSRGPLNEQSIIVSLNPVHGTKPSNTGNNSFASPQSLTNIRLQKLPFFEVIAECIKPTILYGSEKCSQFVANGMREAVFKLIMEPSHVNYISENLDVSNGKPKYLYQAQIRICVLKNGSTEITDCIPMELSIRIGNKTCPLPPTPPNTKPGTRRSARPINCTQLLKLNPTITQTITVNWSPDGLTYIFTMYIVKKLTPETLLMKLKEKPARSVDKTKNDIIRNLSNQFDPDLATTSYRVSIMCPLGQVKMNLPAKSSKCDHLQCFDAKTFILMNERKPTWMCPTCSKPCLFDDIQIETYFLEIVTSPNLADGSEEIELLSDGTWRIFEKNNDLKNLESSADTKEKPIDTVNLHDSDDDNPTEFKKEIDGCVKKESENLKFSFVDLTLNDNEGEATKKDEQENEAQAVDVVQPITTAVDTTPQVQPQQAVTSSVQDVIIELDSPSPPVTPTPTSTD